MDNQDLDKETATGPNLNANPSNTYVSPNVTNGLVNVNPIKPKGSKKKTLIIAITCMAIFVIIPIALVVSFLSDIFKPGYEKAQEMAETNLSKNCSRSETYFDGFPYGSGGEMSGTGYGWIGLCDNEIIIAGSPGKVWAPASDYIYHQDAFDSDISPEVESTFPDSPYYFRSYGNDTVYHNLKIVLHGNTWDDVKKYRASIISLTDKFKNIYDNDNDDISIDIYLTPDNSFNNNYYKAVLFSYAWGQQDTGFDESKNVLSSNVHLLTDHGGTSYGGDDGTFAQISHVYINVSTGADSSAAFDKATSYIKKDKLLN